LDLLGDRDVFLTNCRHIFGQCQSEYPPGLSHLIFTIFTFVVIPNQVGVDFKKHYFAIDHPDPSECRVEVKHRFSM